MGRSSLRRQVREWLGSDRRRRRSYIDPTSPLGERLTRASIASCATPVDIADFDEDGDVDGADLQRWKTNFGLTVGVTHTQGDANGDLVVDGADFLIWQRRVGSTGTLTATAEVPEPAALRLLVSGALAMFARRRFAA